MTNPLVSIIVPVYNAQKGLSRCLESICSQTYQELEIIVLNDGSTDDSLAICEQFRAKDPRLVVVDKENEGVSRTRNAGLALAQGDYIQFADSDDVLDPDYTQNLVQAALQHSADLVIAPYWMVIPSNSSKTGHALETLQESLGIEPEAPKTEVHKYGFLPQGVHYDALEVSPAAPLTADVTGYRLLRSSDAHSLEQMLEREFALEAKTRSVDAVFDAIAGRTQPD